MVDSFFYNDASRIDHFDGGDIGEGQQSAVTPTRVGNPPRCTFAVRDADRLAPPPPTPHRAGTPSSLGRAEDRGLPRYVRPSCMG